MTRRIFPAHNTCYRKIVMPNASPEFNTKRSFLKYLMVFVSGFIGFFSSWGIARFVFSGTGQKVDRTISKELFQSINREKPYFIPQAEAWIIKGQNLSESVAFDDRCTHLGCRYKWNQDKDLFECPCHGSEFDIHGQVLRGPATRHLPRLYLTEASSQMLRISEHRSRK
ncbi:MAG: ubiquinol-cytochrome c reductase iron-sulfur subunit [Desulfomonilaceae bacterium]